MIELSIIQKIVIWAIPLLFAISLHEVAHGWVASFFGDQTARLSGRLSLNPLKHIDPVGTIVAPLLTMLMSNFNFVFGWAKPVPVDARNMRNPRRNMAIVALAGPISNILMAIGWGIIARLGIWIDTAGNDWFGIPLIYMGSAGIMINVVLGVLNLIPLPPLDGAKILGGVLPVRSAYYMHLMEPYGFLILLVMMFTGVLSFVLGPPVFFMINLIGTLVGLT
jgi:Zn-dependent protease